MPVASITASDSPAKLPTATIRPPLTATSPMNGLPPLPSMMVPPRISSSQSPLSTDVIGRLLSA